MTEEELQNLDTKLDTWRKTKKIVNKVEDLVTLSTAKGHSDGKWQPVLNINYQVAYQKNISGTNYHNCEELNREVHALIYKDLPTYLAKAIANINSAYTNSMIDLA